MLWVFCTGSYNISDSLGNILFYGNDFGPFNRNNVPMPNDFGLTGTCCENYDKVVIAFQWISDINKYYFFTGGCSESPNLFGLKYSVVDMTLDGG